MSSADSYHFVVGMSRNIPGFFVDQTRTHSGDNSTQFSGTSFDILDWLRQRSNLSFSMVPFLEAHGTINIGGKSNGSFGELLDSKKIDILGPGIGISHLRGKVLEWIGLFVTEDSALVLPPPTFQNRMFSFIEPFSSWVWGLIIVSLIAIGLSLAVVTKMTTESGQQQHQRNKPGFGDYSFNLLAIITNQGETMHLNKSLDGLPLKLVMASWLILALVTMNVYGSILVSRMTARKADAAPQSSLDIAEEGRLSYLLIGSGIGKEIVMSATSGSLKKLGDAFRKHPENFVNSNEEAFRRVTTGCCAYSDMMSSLEFLMKRDYDETHQCRVFFTGIQRGYGTHSFVVAKGNAHHKLLNRRLLEVHQTGLYNYWQRRYSGRYTCQSYHQDNQAKLRPLKSSDFLGAFFVYAVGCAVSTIAFIIELLRRRLVAAAYTFKTSRNEVDSGVIDVVT